MNSFVCTALCSSFHVGLCDEQNSLDRDSESGHGSSVCNPECRKLRQEEFEASLAYIVDY